MLVLIHFKRSNIESKLQKLIILNKDYIQNRYSLEKDVETLLNDTETYFQQIGQTANESRVSSLRTYLETARSGINPETLEIIKTAKRKIIKSSSFHCISTLGVLLEKELVQIDEVLDRNKKTIEQVILSAIQSKIVTENELKQLNDIHDIEVFWNNLKSQQTQVDLIHKKLRLEILNQDIYILLDQIINQIKN